jgi:hypothetical protein
MASASVQTDNGAAVADGRCTPRVSERRARAMGLTLALAGALALVAPVPAFAAPTSQVSCGQVVTTDVRLAADLQCASDTALTVGADGITIDLGGHTIGRPPPLFNPGQTGIANDGHNRVTIRNGTISDYNASVELTGASHNRLVDLSLRVVEEGNEFGVVIDGGRGNVVKDSSVSGRTDAIDVSGSRDRIVDNEVSAAFGDQIDANTDHSVIARNTGTGGDLGVFVGGSHNRIAANALSRAQIGANLIISGVGNVVVGNTFSNAQGDGLHVCAGAPPECSGAEATNTILRRNLATGNAADGIRVDSPSTRLVRNTANDNGDLGIEAVPGVLGILNSASGNGNPLQCVGVTCSP